MEINGVIIDEVAEKLLETRGIKLTDIEKLIALEAAGKVQRFRNEDRSLVIVKGLIALKTFYFEYAIEGNKRHMTDAYAHFINIVSDL